MRAKGQRNLWIKKLNNHAQENTL